MIQLHYDQLGKGMKPLAPLQSAADWNDEDLLPHLVEAYEENTLDKFLKVHSVLDETWVRIKEKYTEEFL